MGHADATSHHYAPATEPPPSYSPADDAALQNLDHIVAIHTTVRNHHTFAENSAQARTPTFVKVLRVVFLVVWASVVAFMVWWAIYVFKLGGMPWP